jgi:hypothetical protein
LVEEFTMPKEGSWFSFDPKKARKWGMWGADKGRLRVLEFEVTRSLSLLDARSSWDWIALAEELKVEETTYEMRKAVLKARLPGWFGKTEVMISEPKKAVRLVRTVPSGQGGPQG